MPEADRFERKIPPHWRQAYRVAKTGREDFGIIVDCLMPAFRETLTRHTKPESFVEVFELLVEAVEATNGAQQSLLDWTAHIARLDASLDTVEVTREEDLCIRVIARAALCAYGRLQSEHDPVGDHERVRDVFADAFGEVMLEHQWFPKIRRALMDARKRDLDGQQAWEGALLATLQPQMRAFFKTLFSTKRIPRRVPSRLTKRMEITQESLSQPIDLSRSRRE